MFYLNHRLLGIATP